MTKWRLFEAYQRGGLLQQIETKAMTLWHYFLLCLIADLTLPWLVGAFLVTHRRVHQVQQDIAINTPKRLFELRAESSEPPASPSPFVFTETSLFSDIADAVQKQVEVPFVPAPLVSYCLLQALQRISHDISPETLSRIEEMLAAEKTVSAFDDFNEDEVNDLADQVSQQISDKGVIDLPMLTKEQELKLLQQIMRVVFKVVTTSEAERRKELISSELHISHDILSSLDSRRQLAKTVNEAVDIPLLSEDQEESILEAAVEMCATTLQTLLPPSLISTLKGETPEGLSTMKGYLIKTVNEKIDLIGFSEEQEEVMIRTIIEILIDTYVDDTDAELLILSQEEQEMKLQNKVIELEREMKASEVRFAREQNNLKAQIQRIRDRIEQTKS